MIQHSKINIKCVLYRVTLKVDVKFALYQVTLKANVKLHIAEL